MCPVGARENVGMRLKNAPPSRSGEFNLIKVTPLIFNEVPLVDGALITMGALEWFGAECLHSQSWCRDSPFVNCGPLHQIHSNQ